MTEYGTIINSQLIVHKSYQDGDKPLKYTKEPIEQGKKGVYSWTEEASGIVQVWELVDDDSDPHEHDEVDDTEALSILLGGTE